MQKALDERPPVIMGPIYSGWVKVNMALAQEAMVPQFVGAQAEGNAKHASNSHHPRMSVSVVAPPRNHRYRHSRSESCGSVAFPSLFNGLCFDPAEDRA